MLRLPRKLLQILDRDLGIFRVFCCLFYIYLWVFEFCIRNKRMSKETVSKQPEGF